MLDIKNMFTDFEEFDGKAPGKIEIDLPSDGHTLNAMLLNAPYKEKRPLVVMLHGFPGHERNLDLAEHLRRAGCHVLFFHYRGAWGSPGHFTFEGVLNDANNAFEYMKANADKYGINTDLMFAVGHSMGGFATIHTLAKRGDLAGAVALAPYDFAASYENKDANEQYSNNFTGVVCGPLAPLNLEFENVLVEELAAKHKEWLLPSLAPKLKGKNMMIIKFDQDKGSIAPIHFDPLKEAFTPEMGDKLTLASFNTDHGYNSCRIGVAKKVAEWIDSLCKAK